MARTASRRTGAASSCSYPVSSTDRTAGGGAKAEHLRAARALAPRRPDCRGTWISPSSAAGANCNRAFAQDATWNVTTRQRIHQVGDMLLGADAPKCRRTGVTDTVVGVAKALG